MNIEILIRKAITIIKLKYGIPKSGFLTGGSLSAIIWELVSGNKAIINDIDVFNLLSTKEPTFIESEDGVKKSIPEKEYISVSIDSDSFLEIKNSKRDGIFNFISCEIYSIKKDNFNLILKSFDINSTQVGY